MPKKILVVDDSALMRRVLCDIIDTDIRIGSIRSVEPKQLRRSCPGCEYAAYERPAAFTGAA